MRAFLVLSMDDPGLLSDASWQSCTGPMLLAGAVHAMGNFTKTRPAKVSRLSFQPAHAAARDCAKPKHPKYLVPVTQT